MRFFIGLPVMMISIAGNKHHPRATFYWFGVEKKQGRTPRDGPALMKRALMLSQIKYMLENNSMQGFLYGKLEVFGEYFKSLWLD